MTKVKVLYNDDNDVKLLLPKWQLLSYVFNDMKHDILHSFILAFSQEN